MSEACRHQDVEAEIITLGSILHPGATAEDVVGVSSIITAEDFHVSAHGLIFDAAVVVAGNGHAAEYAVGFVLTELRRRGQDTDVVRNALATCVEVPSPAHAEHYADRVRIAADLRAIRDLGMSLTQEVQTSGADALLAMLDDRVATIRKRASGGCLRVHSASDLLKRDPIEQRWLVDGALARGEIGLVAADSGLGKTWLVLDGAVALVRGDPTWLGRTLNGPGRVLLLFAEGGEEGLRLRLAAITEERGAIPDGDGLAFWTPIDDTLDLLDSQDLARLEAAIVRGRYDLVIADPLADLSSGDEDNQAFRAISRGLRLVANRTGAALLLIHHVRKPTLLTQPGSGHEVRGGSALKAAVDALLILEAVPNDDTQLHLTFSKVRNAPAPPMALLERRESGRIEYIADAPTHSGGPKVSHGELMDILIEAGQAMSYADLAEVCRVTEKTVKRYLETLPDDAQIRRVKTGKTVYIQYAPMARWEDSRP